MDYIKAFYPFVASFYCQLSVIHDKYIKAGDDGIIGKDSVQIRDGSINIECADDCIKSSKDDDPEKGYVVIDGGDITLASDEGHGVQAVYVFVMNDGKLTVKGSNEGIESLNIVQNGGIIDINSKDDGVNVSDKRADSESESTDAGNEAAADNKDMQPKGDMMPEGTDGQMQPKAGRQMQPGSLSANAGPGGSMGKGGRGRMGGGRMGPGNMDGNTEGGPAKMGGNMGGGGTFENIDGCIVINGGEITINAGGDGLDSNGDILIKGGTVRVYGPTGNGNSAVDKNGIWEQDGGTVYIQGSSGMLESVDTESSDEGFVSVIFDGNVNEGEEISLIDSDGNTVMSFTSQKSVPFVFFASEEIENGKEYTVRAGSLSQTVTAGQMSGSGMGPGFGGRGTDL